MSAYSPHSWLVRTWYKMYILFHHLIDPGTSVSHGTGPSAAKTNLPLVFWTLSFRNIETYNKITRITRMKTAWIRIRIQDGNQPTRLTVKSDWGRVLILLTIVAFVIGMSVTISDRWFRKYEQTRCSHNFSNKSSGPTESCTCKITQDKSQLRPEKLASFSVCEHVLNISIYTHMHPP